MAADQRGMATWGVLLLVLGVLLAAGNAWVQYYGWMQVSVTEKHPGGDHVRLILPAAVVPAAMAFVPAEALTADMPPEARDNLHVASVALRELERLPDCTLVQVDGPGEHVRIRVIRGTLAVDVDSADEEVHVSFPLRAVSSAVSGLCARPERARGNPGARSARFVYSGVPFDPPRDGDMRGPRVAL